VVEDVFEVVGVIVTVTVAIIVLSIVVVVGTVIVVVTLFVRVCITVAVVVTVFASHAPIESRSANMRKMLTNLILFIVYPLPSFINV
jgi:hypothetical protein